MRSFNSANPRIQAGSKKKKKRGKKKNPNGNHGDGRRRASLPHTHTLTGVRRDACYNTENTFSSVNTAAVSTHVQKKPFPPFCCCQHELKTHHVHAHMHAPPPTPRCTPTATPAGSSNRRRFLAEAEFGAEFSRIPASPR